MENTDLVLSDIHMNKVAVGSGDGLEMTRFKFTLHCIDCACRDCQPYSHRSGPMEVDEDGDFVKMPPRLRDRDVIRIFHRMATDLASVGLQVWRGALLACDYIFHNQSRLASKHVLELGSGTGLAGIVAGKFADSVTCTDVGDDVIRLCRKNVEENARHFASGHQVSVQTLDWFSEIDVNDFVNPPQIIVAADCVYDNELTDALFRILFNLMTMFGRASVDAGNLFAVVTLEKRLNFTLDDYDVTCNEYDHFRTCLSELVSCDGFSANQMCVESLPQYFEYDRTKYVDLWEISYTKS